MMMRGLYVDDLLEDMSRNLTAGVSSPVAEFSAFREAFCSILEFYSENTQNIEK